MGVVIEVREIGFVIVGVLFVLRVCFYVLFLFLNECMC